METTRLPPPALLKEGEHGPCSRKRGSSPRRRASSLWEILGKGPGRSGPRRRGRGPRGCRSPLEGRAGRLLRPRLLPGHVHGRGDAERPGPDGNPHSQRGERVLQRLHSLLASLLGHNHRPLRRGAGLRRREGPKGAGDRHRRGQARNG